MAARHETVIVGGGHAGLALSYHLSRLGRPHVILERGRVAERWRSERWDSLMFQFPNWSLRLPGQEYRGDAARRLRVAGRGHRLHRALPRGGRRARANRRPRGPGPRRSTAASGSRPRRARSRPPTSSSPPARTRSRSCRPSATPFRRASSRCMRAAIAIRRSSRPARCSSSARAPPGARSWRTCSRRAGPCTSRWGATGAIRAATAATTCSGGWSGSARSTRRSRSAPRRASGRTRSSPGSAAATTSTCATTRPPASRCWGISGTSRARGFIWPTTSATRLAAGDESVGVFTRAVDAYVARSGLAAPAEAPPPRVAAARAAPPAPIRELDLAASGITSVVWATGFRARLRMDRRARPRRAGRADPPAGRHRLRGPLLPGAAVAPQAQVIGAVRGRGRRRPSRRPYRRGRRRAPGRD